MLNDKASDVEDERDSKQSTHVLQAPINIRSSALAVLAILAAIAFLYFARTVFIPISIAVLLNYALSPIVRVLHRRVRLPRVLGAALTLALVICGMAYGVRSLQPQTVEILDMVPRATAKMTSALRLHPHEPASTVGKIQKAVSGLEKAADAAVSTAAPPVPASSARLDPALPATPIFNFREYAVIGTASVISGMGQLIIIVFLTFFLLSAGDNFRRSLVHITGGSLARNRITVQVLDEIDTQIQRYLWVQILTSGLVGLLLWVAFAQIGLDHAIFWACSGGVLHLIPYAGPTVLVGLVTLVSYVQFDSLQTVLLLVAVVLALVSIVGMLIVPWLTQRLGHLNTVTVFIALLFWGWLWGVWGLLLGVPIVMAVNAVCERVADLKPISELLSRHK